MSIGAELRAAYPQALARLSRKLGSLPDAEDALHSAVVRALETWPERGVPEHPDRWLVTAASNRVIDLHRARSRRQARVPDLLAAQAPWRPPRFDGWRDDALRLVVTCCDPALGLDERTALTLATVGGLSTQELAGAFLVQRTTMEQRLVRARRRLRERSSGETPPPEATGDRLAAVLAVIHVLHAEGAWSSTDAPIRADLCAFAHALATSVTLQLPGEPEALALLALLEMHRGRLPARRVGDRFVPLEHQDRALWDRAALARGRELLDRALNLGAPGPFQIEAAISAVHCEAATADATDWPQIALLYEALERHRPSPIVTVNRAFALGMASGPRVGLAVLEQVASHPALARWPYLPLVQGALLAEAGRLEEAAAALRSALDRARNPEEARQIAARLETLEVAT